jgi:hypothetical protein
MLVAAGEAGGQLVTGATLAPFDVPPATVEGSRVAPAPDRRRFLVITPGDPRALPSLLTLVLGWPQIARKR